MNQPPYSASRTNRRSPSDGLGFLCPALVGVAWQRYGWGMNSPYQRVYNPATVETLTGEIVSIGTMSPMKGMSISLAGRTGKGWDKIDRIGVIANRFVTLLNEIRRSLNGWLY